MSNARQQKPGGTDRGAVVWVPARTLRRFHCALAGCSSCSAWSKSRVEGLLVIAERRANGGAGMAPFEHEPLPLVEDERAE